MADDPNKLNDLTRSVLYKEVPNQQLTRLTVIVVCIGFMLFVAWSSITHVHEVARTQGKIIPSGYAQIVQHLEGGMISNIFIEEGDLVEKNQLLVRMDSIGAKEDFASLSERQTALLLQAERLRALAHNQEANFSEITKNNSKAVAYQQNILESSRQAYEFQKSVIQDQLSQKQQAIIRLENQKITAQKELAAGNKLLGMRQGYAQKGSVSRKEIIDSERDVTRLKGEVQKIDGEMTEALQAISEYQNRLQTLEASRRNDALQELEEIETQIAENKETLSKLRGRVNRLEVRAPVRGLVQGLRVNTIGGVVAAGEPLMEIIPLDHTLIVEAQIPPRDIGNLQVGQNARVKVSAYDFSRYGVIEGTLQFLSATTFIDENEESFYKGRIAMNQDYVGSNPNRNFILPGMTVEADIITGEKTILAYLLKPIHTSLHAAFREK